MTFDIIEISEAEVKDLETVRLKLLRTAQQKKDELYHKLQSEIAEQKRLLYSNGMENSSLFTDIVAELTAEYEYQVEIIREQLLFNMSLGEPTAGGETGGSGTENSAYLVDYELSYIERYVHVRDYYFTIEDPNERIAVLREDEVARKYLGTYYNTLFNYLIQFTYNT
ncbi:MAG: hypothetical protein NC033_02385 [Clostridiales bacterium]|nr:hypothetical protein [Clostridiales bacterium]